MKKNALVLSLFGALVLLSGCAWHTKEYGMGIPAPSGLWVIQYGTCGDRLSFAVISGPSPVSVQGYAHMGETFWGHAWAELVLPDGGKIPIAGTDRVYFVSGTNVDRMRHSISADTFGKFLDSRPDDYSMSTLAAFAAKSETKAAP